VDEMAGLLDDWRIEQLVCWMGKTRGNLLVAMRDFLRAVMRALTLGLSLVGLKEISMDELMAVVLGQILAEMTGFLKDVPSVVWMDVRWVPSTDATSEYETGAWRVIVKAKSLAALWVLALGVMKETEWGEHWGRMTAIL